MSREENVPDRTDVLVLGAGLAGLCAAIAAAEAGGEVLLLEKTDKPGGSSAYAGGGFTFVGTDLQRDAGMSAQKAAEDSDALRAQFFENGKHQNDPALVGVYMQDQLATYDFLRDHGVRFALGPARAGAVTWMHWTGTGRAVEALYKAALETKGLRYLSGAAATRLHRDADGRVRRATISHAGGATDVTAARGVVLATGGFSRGKKLLQIYAPELVDALPHGGLGNTGDGLVMATALGAGHADLGYVTGSFGGGMRNYPDPPPADDVPPLLFSFAAGGIMLNKNGQRFVNEAQSYKALSTLGMAQPGGVAFQVFDQKVMDASMADTSVNNFRDALAQGYIRKADTIAEMARVMMLDPGAVEATIARYNADARASGVDSMFGRQVARNAQGALMTIDAPAFYIAATGNALTSTYGGITVNADMGVVDLYGEAIPGLYAAGEVTGGFYGALYLSGTSLSRSAIAGRRAGMRAAAQTGG